MFAWRGLGLKSEDYARHFDADLGNVGVTYVKSPPRMPVPTPLRLHTAAIREERNSLVASTPRYLLVP